MYACIDSMSCTHEKCDTCLCWPTLASGESSNWADDKVELGIIHGAKFEVEFL